MFRIHPLWTTVCIDTFHFLETNEVLVLLQIVPTHLHDCNNKMFFVAWYCQCMHPRHDSEPGEYSEQFFWGIALSLPLTPVGVLAHAKSVT